MTVWKAERQADRLVARWDRVGKPRVGPLPGDTRDRFLYSIRTREEYRRVITAQAKWAKKNFRATLDWLTPDQAEQYLKERAAEVGREGLSQERCALALNDQLRPYEDEWQRTIQPTRTGPGRLAVIERVLKGDEPQRIMDHQNQRNRFATEVALAGGLRASELLTLRPRNERKPTPRQAWDPARFEGMRDPVFYTVKGKGGLVREVAFERELAERIEDTRHPDGKPHPVYDRGVPRFTRYNLAGGNAWSKSSQRACKQALGESLGAHSCRHTFVERRMADLQAAGYSEGQAHEFVSQQIGHFRPGITEAYRRG